MHYHCTPPVLHKDVNPSNILLDATLCRAKVGDFGLAKPWLEHKALRSPTNSAPYGTLPYLCPLYLALG